MFTLFERPVCPVAIGLRADGIDHAVDWSVDWSIGVPSIRIVSDGRATIKFLDPAQSVLCVLHATVRTAFSIFSRKIAYQSCFQVSTQSA